MLLAGDVGGTKTLLGLFEPARGRPRVRTVATFVTAAHDRLETIIARFLQSIGPVSIEAACFGVAGPVIDQRARLTNVPWEVSTAQLAAAFRFRSVSLLNDLQAMAYSIPVLEPRELAVLHAGRAVPTGNGALIAAGTGLGQALLLHVNGQLVASPSEGGHADFSPRTSAEVRLLEMLTSLYGRAEWEHVLSGPGLVNLHRFTHLDGCKVCDPSVDPPRAPALISQAALDGTCPSCAEALNMFVSAFGAEAGNLALRSVATRGVFIGGGIAPKILTALQGPAFLSAFRSKPPMDGWLDDIPVSVILNDQAALVGAAAFASRARSD